MGIPIRGKGPRRSYADYRPPNRKQGPQNDIFRIVLYLVFIAGAAWVILNPAQAEGWVTGIMPTPQPTALAGPVTPEPGELAPDQVLANAEQKFHDGLLDEAIEGYTLSAEAMPNQVEIHVALTRALLFNSAMQYGGTRDQTLQKALEAGNRAILADPERPEGYAIYGKVLDWSGKPEEASVQLARALELNEDNAVSQSYMAEALIDLQRYDQANATIDIALGLGPDNFDVRRDYGYILESLGDYEGAAMQYESALGLEPNLPFMKMDLARVYRAIGRFNESLDLLFDVDTHLPDNALVQFELGRTYETYIGDPVSAVEYYQHATTADPNYASPYVRLGVLSYLQADWEGAIEAYEKAFDLGITGTATMYAQLGIAYANVSKCPQAVTNLQKAEAALDPEDTASQGLIEEGYAKCPSAATPAP